MAPANPTERLFHVSDRPGIIRFEPRPVYPHHPQADALPRPIVWAIGERLLHNYLLPRDCPRVTFYARPDSDPNDVARLMGQTAAGHVVAIESGWLAAVRAATLYLYEFPPEGFYSIDQGAAHYVCDSAVTPIGMSRVDDLLAELTAHDVELRVTPSLWPLRDAVLASSLQFSFIRMRHARPRSASA
jgi:hypothetical protein